MAHSGHDLAIVNVRVGAAFDCNMPTRSRSILANACSTSV
jgi:hypothetical protein